MPVVARRNSGYFAHNFDAALLVDEELADQVWEAWDVRQANDQIACIAWMLIAGVCSAHDKSVGYHNDV